MVLTDQTGDYDVSTNATGWGTIAPSPPDNINKSMVDLLDPMANYIKITMPDESEYQFDLSDFVSSFQTDNLIYQVQNINCGLAVDAIFPDGVYEIEYFITNSAYPLPANDQQETVFTRRRFFSICYTQKRIDELLVKFAELMLCGNCDTKYMDQLYMAFVLFEALKDAALCGAESRANAIYTRLYKMLNLIDYDYML